MTEEVESMLNIRKKMADEIDVFFSYCFTLLVYKVYTYKQDVMRKKCNE